MANSEKAFERHLAADKKWGRGSSRELTYVPLSSSADFEENRLPVMIGRRRG